MAHVVLNFRHAHAFQLRGGLVLIQQVICTKQRQQSSSSAPLIVTSQPAKPLAARSHYKPLASKETDPHQRCS
jgi:hypothetical protein